MAKIYKDFIAPQIKTDEENAYNMVNGMQDDDDDIKDIIEMLDGGETKEIVITEEGPISQTEFYANLVDVLPLGELDDLYVDLEDYVEKDKAARQEKDKRYAQCLKRLGYSHHDRIGGANFQGASTVTHNAMAVAGVDFASRAIKEICPAEAQVKAKIVGTATNEKIKLAKRKVDFYNYYLTEVVRYRNIQEVNFSQLPYSGQTYLKWGYNKRKKRAICEFVPVDMVYLPIYTQDFYSADRITHKLEYSEIQFKKLLRDKLYSLRHVEENGLLDTNDTKEYLGTGTTYSDDMGSEAQQVSARIDGVDDTADDQSEEDAGLKTLYEIHLDLEIMDDPISDGELAPYIVTIDANENSVLSVYRNWEIGDKNYEAKEWFVDWKFLIWRGAYGIGYAELFDGTSAALTGILRALLDAGHTANFPTLIMAKGAGAAGQNVNVNPGEVMEIEGPTGVETDIKKWVMPLQLAQPQPVLLELMQNLEKQFSTLFSATENLSESMASGREVPVGTTMALIEESSKRMSAIHARLHESNARSLKILGRILKENIEAIIDVENAGDAFLITPKDFENSNDIIPVSNPNIFCNAQRIAQLQNAFQMAQGNPELYNLPELHRRMLQLMEVPDPDAILNTAQDAGEINALAENIAVMSGLPIKVYSKQDHVAHFTCHLQALENAVYANPVLLPKFGMQLAQHAMQHVIELYAHVANEMLVQSGQNPLDLTKSDAQIDGILAQLNPAILQSVDDIMAPYQERVAKVMEAVQKAMPKPPVDPKIQLEQMKMEAEQKYQEAEMQMEQVRVKAQQDLEQMKIQMQAKNDAADLQIAQTKAMSDVHIAERKADTDAAQISLDMIKTMSESESQEMNVAKELMLNEHVISSEKAQQELDALKAGADIHNQHLQIQQAQLQQQLSNQNQNNTQPAE